MNQPNLIAVDCETTGLDERVNKLHGISVCWAEGEAAYYPIWDIPLHIRSWLANPAIKKVGHNIRFDIKFIRLAGLDFGGVFYDTMHMAQQVDENGPLGLKPLAIKYLGEGVLANKYELDQAMHKAGVKDIGAFCAIDLLDESRPHYAIISKYGIEDAVNTFSLYNILRAKLKETHEKLNRILGLRVSPLTNYLNDIMPVEPVLLSMELSGVAVDRGRIASLRKEAEIERDGYLKELGEACVAGVSNIEAGLYQQAVAARKSEAGKARVQPQSEKYKTRFNWESGKHVGKLFVEQFYMPPGCIERTASGEYATDETYLKNLPFRLPKNHALIPVLRVYAKYKKTLKTIGTYTGNDESGLASHIRVNKSGLPMIYAQYPQTTTTGRLAPKRPNLANLPRGEKIKSFFIPRSRDNVFLYADYSQLQLRIAAHESQDPVLMEAYQLGLDLHKRTGSRMYDIPESAVSKAQRQNGKTVNFALLFNASKFQLMRELKDKNGLDFSLEQCAAFREAVYADWKGYRAYLDKQLAFLKKYKFVITAEGRIRRLPDIVYDDFLNFRRKEFTGPRALREKLLYHPNENPSPEELFKRASNKVRHAKNQAFCMPIQGLESSIVKRAMVAISKAGYQLRNQVHDSILVEIHNSQIEKARHEITHLLENTYKLRVPLTAEVKILRSFDESDVYQQQQDPPAKPNLYLVGPSAEAK